MNSYFIAAMKRSGQHGVINWLAQQIPNDVLHFNNCEHGWDDMRLAPMKDAMAVFYRWDNENQVHDVKNYFHDWKLDLQKNKRLIHEFYLSANNNVFKDVDSVIYNVEDFDTEIFDKKQFSKFPQLKNCKKILVVRSAENFVGSCLQRKIDPPDPGATDVADNLMERMKLWEQHAAVALDDTNDWYVIKFDTWFSSPDYRKKICDDLNLQFTDNGLNSVMNFGSGSSFDRQNFDNNAQKMSVLERWKQYPDQEKLWSYINSSVDSLNQRLFEGTKK